jgi:hypothetical protein
MSDNFKHSFLESLKSTFKDLSLHAFFVSESITRPCQRSMYISTTTLFSSKLCVAPSERSTLIDLSCSLNTFDSSIFYIRVLRWRLLGIGWQWEALPEHKKSITLVVSLSDSPRLGQQLSSRVSNILEKQTCKGPR